MANSSVGEVLKEEGIERVMSNAPDDWKTKVLKTAPELLRRMEFVMGEDIRFYCNQKGCGQPHHPNAWGGVMSGLAKQGLIEKTGTVKKVTDPRGHATTQLVWKSKLFNPAANQQLNLDLAA